MEEHFLRKVNSLDAEQLLTFKNSKIKGDSLLSTLTLNDDVSVIKKQLEDSNGIGGTYVLKDLRENIVASCTYFFTFYRNRYTFLQIDMKKSEDLTVMKSYLEAFVKLSFEDLGFNKINMYLGRKDSILINLLTEMGFQIEVVLNEHHYTNGYYEDVLHFGLLKSEFPAKVIEEYKEILSLSEHLDNDHLLKPIIEPNKNVLRGEKVELVNLNQDDMNKLKSDMLQSDADYYSSIAAVGPKSSQSIESMLTCGHDYYFLNSNFLFGIKEIGGDVIGTISADFIDQRNSNLMLGIVIYQTLDRNNGYGSEAITLLTDFCFLELNMHRVYLGCFSFNKNAFSVYKKLGFAVEGINRSFVYRNGNYYDEIAFGVVKEQWLRKRGYLS